MAEARYAFIKDETVVNVVIFDDPTNELLNHFKQEFELDAIVLATSTTDIGGTYDGAKFWLPKPYSSWVKGDEKWQPPTPYPTDDKLYTWDEPSLTWLEIQQP